MRYQATILVVISLSVVVGVIIDKPIVFPDDMGPLPLGGWRADDRMHKAVQDAAKSRHHRILVRKGSHKWMDGHQWARGMHPDGPKRMSLDYGLMQQVIRRKIMRKAAKMYASEGFCPVELRTNAGGGVARDVEEAIAELKRKEAADPPTENPWVEVTERIMESSSEDESESGEEEVEQVLKKTADPEDFAKQVSEGIYWLKNWAGGIPGLVNRDVHVNGKVRFIGEGQEDEQVMMPRLEGSFKLLDDSQGSFSGLALENDLGSVVEIWSSAWDIKNSSILCAGHHGVAPVAVFAHRCAEVSISSSRLSKLSTGRKRDVALTGLYLCDRAYGRMSDCLTSKFKTSDVSCGDAAKVDLTQCTFDGVNGTRFGLEMAGRALVTAVNCSFLDHRGAAFAAWAVCDEASLNTSGCIVKGQVWNMLKRPGGGVLEEGMERTPGMAVPGREDTRWDFPLDDDDLNSEGTPDDPFEDMVPSSCSQDDEVRSNFEAATQALEGRAREGKPVGPEEFEGFCMSHFDGRAMWLRDLPDVDGHAGGEAGFIREEMKEATSIQSPKH